MSMSASEQPEPEYLTGKADRLAHFIDQFDTFLFDCDGVLWSGDKAFPGTVDVLEKLRAGGKKVVFVTNNSTKSRADYKTKFTNLGIPAEIDEIFSSAYSSAIYISRLLALPPDRRTIFVLGQSGIEAELSSEGLRHLGGTDPSFDREMTTADYASLADGTALDPSVGAVLCGLDSKASYLKLAHAYHYIKYRSAVFLATNTDATFPHSNALFPGAGAIMSPLVTALGLPCAPEGFGKPSQRMMDAIESRFTLDRRRTCMVGDRLDTDIRFGREGGLGGTLCVLTGVTQSQADWASGVKPSAWVDKLADLALGMD